MRRSLALVALAALGTTGLAATGSTAHGFAPHDNRAAPAAPASSGASVPQPVAGPDRLSRGVISLRRDDGNFVSWRLLVSDPAGVAFNVYRDGAKLNKAPVSKGTNYYDAGGPAGARYSVRPVVRGVEQLAAASAPDESVGTLATSMDVPLQIPGGGTTPSGENYTYTANDASVGDLDGDGQYEIVLKWDPTNAKDNSQSGYTGNVYIDAYELDGTRKWRIDLGRNIRAGAHYTQFQVFDYDGDGRAEVAMKTADATRSGTGQVIGNAGADHRNSSGYILSGPEFLSVFRGTDGAVLDTENYVPPRGNVSDWGDNYGNRVDRFLAGTAYVDGSNPSIIMARGYYTRSVVVAWDFRNGQLTRRWTFDSNSTGSQWSGKGNHQLSVADVDNDGRDEIMYGSMAVDDNGSGLWQNNTHHGDAYHVSDFIPSRAGLEVFKPSEWTSEPAHWMGDARTGQILWSAPACGDNGRGVAADIWAGNSGAEAWSSCVGGLRSGTNGSQVASRKPGSTNFVIWWDGDAQRELLDGTHIDKYGTGGDTRLLTGSGVSSNNGTKSTPALSADILGDWREEVIWRTSDNSRLRIYSTTDSTSISQTSLMQDRQYRLAVAWQNTAYNQPPHPSFASPGGSSGGGGDTYANVVARHSGKCLDVYEASTANAAGVVQWACGSGTNQQWQTQDAGGGYVRLVARHSGQCLDVNGASTADGALVIQYPCGSGTNQQWQLQDAGGGYARLVARHSGKCLDVSGVSTADGAQIQQWACGSGTNQQWAVRSL